MILAMAWTQFTLIFSDCGPRSVQLALRVSRWTIENLQDASGYFYYRRFSNWRVNKVSTRHWWQATMLCALAGLYKRL